VLSRADDLADGSVLHSDVCIIGAGAAGITLALELTGSGLNVVLLESGDVDPDPATQDLYDGENVGDPLTVLDGEVSLDTIRLRYLGGTTNHWAGYCRPLEPVDFLKRDSLAISGWPMERRELLPYWERAAQWCRITDGEFSPTVWHQRSGLKLPPIDNAIVAPITFQVAFPMPFGAVYRNDLRRADHLRVVLGANVVNLRNDRRRIVGVDVRTLAGRSLRAEAGAYVVATGGIENARLLLASTDTDPAGVGNSTDLVGRHFTEHLQVFAGFGIFEAPFDDLIGFHGTDVTIATGRHAGATHGVKYGLALTSDQVIESRSTGLEVQFLLGHLPAGMPYEPAGSTMSRVAALYDAVGGDGRRASTSAYVQVLAEQRLDPESRVTLSKLKDPFGMPRTRLDWQYGAADRAAVLTGLRTVAEQIGAGNAGRLQIIPGGVHADAADHLVSGELISLYRSMPDDFDPTGFPIGIGFHHMCTTRMADDPTEGVVDADCRVHDVDNLWISGSSVFATGGVATPTYTIVALAVRLADHLKDVVNPRA